MRNHLLRSAGSIETELSFIARYSLLYMSSVDLGSPSNFRYIIICLSVHGGSRRAPILSTVSVSGISASMVSSITTGVTQASIWIAKVPTGSTGSITYTGSFIDALLSSAFVYRLVTSKGSTAYDDQTGSTSVTLGVPEKGVAVGCCIYRGPVDNVWTNLSEDFQLTSADVSSSSAHAINLTAGSLPISVTNSENLATASWL